MNPSISTNQATASFGRTGPITTTEGGSTPRRGLPALSTARPSALATWPSSEPKVAITEQVIAEALEEAPAG
jgi:hypothetical protein